MKKMTITKNNQGQQTELVKSRLINYIREEKLSVGDKLPSQIELREQFKVGSKTIQRALQTLAADGIVSLHKNRGVYLLRTDAGGYRGRRIGLVCMRLPNCVPANMLLQCLQMELHDRGADCINFLRNQAPMTERDSLDLFPGLERAIVCHTVDGLISTVPLDDAAVTLCKQYHMPFCYHGDRRYYENCTLRKNCLPDALQKLNEAGCQRPAVLFTSIRQKTMHEEEAFILLRKTSRKTSFSLDLDDNFPRGQDFFLAKAERVTKEYRSLPEKERPDGLYIPDDFLAAAFVMYLLLNKCPLPKLIVQRWKQIPVAFPCPLVGWYEQDMVADAEKIADLMFDLLHDSEEKKRNVLLETLYHESVNYHPPPKKKD